MRVLGSLRLEGGLRGFARVVAGFYRLVEGTHRLLSSSFLGLPYRILNMNPKKELLRSLWVIQ